MGRSCSVPNCRSNYGTSVHVTTYSFPKGDTEESLKLRNKWLKSINRVNWTPGKYSCVCIQHFCEEFLVREDVMPRDDGTVLRMARERIALKEGAYPTIFNFKSSLVSSELPAEPEEKRARVEKACVPEPVKSSSKLKASDDIRSFIDFKHCCKDKVDQTWIPIFFDNCVHFVRYDPILFRAEMCLQVKHNLQFVVYCNSVALPQEQFPFMATNEQFLCDKWSKFETLLAQLKHWNVEERSFEMCVKEASSLVLSCTQILKCKVCNNFCNGVCSCDNNENEEKIILLKKLIFIQEQLDSLISKQPSFSPEILLWAFTLNFENPSGYCNLRDTQVLSLPHPMYLKKMSVKVSEHNQTVLKSGLLKYLTGKCKKLNETERLVNVIVDRIPIKSQSRYKNGHVDGDLLNCKGVTAVQTFMLSSVYSEYREMVGIFPVKKESADQLHEYINQVLSVLHHAGFTALSLISGNYQVDRLAFTHYGIGRLQVKVKNPVVPEKFIFPMFDNNHLLKSIRDDWLDQHGEDQAFVFPNFDDFMIIDVASMRVLKDLHHKEASKFVQKDLTLSQKVLYPLPAEKQNLSLAIKLFDQKTIAAVEKAQNALGTVKFLQVIQTWWKVVNVKKPPTISSPTDPYQSPIDSASHDSYQFLVKFERWLRAWEHLAVPRPKHKAKEKYPSGKLCSETFKALTLSTRAMIKICDDLLDLGSIHYVPLGKFQSDKITGSFGLYQQLSGSCLSASVQEVLESKQKPSCRLKLKSATKGAFELTDVLETCSISVDNNIDDVIDSTFQSVVCDSDCNDVSTEQIEALIYIGGYAGEKALQSIKCSFCRDFLLDSSRQLPLADLPNKVGDDVRSTGRDCLVYPTEFTMNICLSALKVFQTLIGNAYEEEFLASSSQRKIVMKLVMERLYTLNIILDIHCECGVGMSVLVQKCCSTLTNIFLYNYIVAQ